MILEKPALPGSEVADVQDTLRLNAHPFQRSPVGDRRDDHVAGIFESNEPAVEEMIDAWRQEEAVLTV